MEVREEGELSHSDEDGGYTPLERPLNYRPYTARAPMNDPSDESEQEEAESSDSDSDRPTPRKRRVRVRRPRTASRPATKYDVWCGLVQEDSLAEDLLVCDVTATKCLGVESYPVPENRRAEREEEWSRYREEYKLAGTTVSQNKRRYRERRDRRLRPGRRPSCDSDGDKEGERLQARHIPELTVDDQSPVEDVAKDIANKLHEEKENLILRIVENAGITKAIEIYKETKKIEEDGGMVIRNGTRRRTPGGVFIFLLKRDKDVTREMVSRIFLEDKLEAKERFKANRNRNQKVEELKQTLTDLPVIRTRAEQYLAQVEDLNHVSNPPPSPATDGRDGSSDVDSNFVASPRRNSTDPSSVSIARETAVLSRLTVNRDSMTVDPRVENSTSYDDDYLDINTDDMDLF